MEAFPGTDDALWTTIRLPPTMHTAELIGKMVLQRVV